MVLLLPQLPNPAIAEISQYLSILECRQFVMSCRSLWRNREIIEKQRSTNIVAHSTAERQVFEQIRPPNIVQLDLGDSVEDDYLITFNWSTEFPCLREIALEGNLNVRMGLRSFYGHPSLIHVNVVFCPLVGFREALELRDHLPQPNAVVQRLPKEMCGLIETNFSNDRFHRYWPDGLFKYDRSEQSLGFVKLLRKNGPRIESVLQFCDFHPESDRNPALTGLEYLLACPSVNLLFLKDGSGQVLVAQSLRTTRPPLELPTMNQSTLELGTTFYFGEDGVAQRTRMESSTHMITRMQVLPMVMPSPPEDVLTRMRQTIGFLAL